MALLRRIIYPIVFCIYIAAVGYLCFARTDDLPQWPQLWMGLPVDKVGHFLMFTPFLPLGYLTFWKETHTISRKITLAGILMVTGLVIAACIELVQSSLEYRSAEIGDLLADGVGLLCGGVLTFTYILTRK